LGREFYLEFERKLEVVSAYRSYAYQKWIKDRGCPDNLCAKAGYSEHQSGLAVDFFEASTQQAWEENEELQKYFEWLNIHAYKYGFINTYQKWVEIDGYEVEPWHWRYVWVQLAEYIIGNNITFAEFYHGESK
jgi:D-alanyl-D-alanine carboxypeptidase